MRQCPRCSEPKDESQFNRKGSGYSAYCKYHNSEYLKQHYEDNKEYYKGKNQRRRDSIRKWLKDYKYQLCCEICGEENICCLDFHHINSSLKSISISHAVIYMWSINRIISEIEKCRVLCSNCHRKIHCNNGQ